MKSVKIVLDKMDSINRFVKIVEKYPFEMDLKSSRYVIDAKSLMGVCSLDTSRPITLEIYSDNCDKLLAELDSYIVKA
jgi:phosphotransferase system HPr-like phosphotransfer protein